MPTPESAAALTCRASLSAAAAPAPCGRLLLLAGGDMFLETASAACCRRNLAILWRAVRVCAQRGRGGSGVGGWVVQGAPLSLQAGSSG